MPAELSLGEKQRAFSYHMAKFEVWAKDEHGYEFSRADGNIDPIRRVRTTAGIVIVRVRDLNHMEEGLHYIRLAQDLNLFIGGKFITDGAHPAWKHIGMHWEGMHPLASWGGRFGDANHFAFTHDGKK